MQQSPYPAFLQRRLLPILLGGLVLLCLLSVPAFADLQKHLTKDYALEQITQWKLEIESSPKLSASEKHKDLDFVSKLQNRVEQESSNDLTGKSIKSQLEFIEKTNAKGSNPLFVNDAQFVSESIQLLDQLEPTENPMIVLKKYLFFASIEKTKPFTDFQNSRSYVNHGASMAADPDDLDEAASYVESKIFSHQNASDEML